jgi:DNA-binding transcriptional regulator YiaG
MSVKSSFREAFEQLEKTQTERQSPSASQAVRLLLVPQAIGQPVTLAKALHKCGMSLKKAHDTLDRLTGGRTVAVELQSDDAEALIAQLRELGVAALQIMNPSGDPKRVREKLGLSQAEFALRFCFELDTLKNWEQGRSRVDAPTSLLLQLIETHTDVVQSATAKNFLSNFLPIDGPKHRLRYNFNQNPVRVMPIIELQKAQEKAKNTSG